MENNENEMLKKARDDFENKLNIPSGFIEVRLSTCGKIGAPPRFYIRNFSTEDVVNLNITDPEERPLKLISILQGLIYEKDVDIKQFHQKEVIELLLLMYEVFYTEVFANQTWIPTEEDLEFLKEECGGEDTDAYRNRIRALNNGQWKPVFDINISKDIKFHEIKDDFKCNAKISRKYGNDLFTATFTLPKFGDIVTLRSFVDTIFKERDRQFARITEIVKFRKDAEDRIRKGENVNLSQIPSIPKAEEDKLREYETEKSLFIFTATIAMYLIEFNGEDVSKVPLEKKLQLAQDPRLDFSTFQTVQEHFNKLEFGMKEEITVFDPILQKVVTRSYPFRLDTLLAAFGNTRPSETDITFV